MKILVTGGEGFIGSNLIKQLVAEGHEVHSLDNLETGNSDNRVDGCNYILGDIEQILWMRGDNFDLCYHLAAMSRLQPSFDDPMETFRVNVTGTQCIAEWARQCDVKVVYAGSASKWGDSTASPYASSKKMGEDILKMYRTSYGCNFEIARFYNVYGPNELVDETLGSVIGIWRYCTENNQVLKINGSGNQKRDFIHVEDIVDGLIKIGMSEETHSDAWELGTGIQYSINELFQMFKERFGKDFWPSKSLMGDVEDSPLQNTDTHTKLGWKPKDRLKEYIQSL
jgi:UDP-glucose 4-epimerase